MPAVSMTNPSPTTRWPGRLSPSTSSSAVIAPDSTKGKALALSPAWRGSLGVAATTSLTLGLENPAAESSAPSEFPMPVRSWATVGLAAEAVRTVKSLGVAGSISSAP